MDWKKELKEHRLWVIWLGALVVVGWNWATDIDHGWKALAGLKMPYVVLKLEWMVWGAVCALGALILRKGLMPGDGKELFRMGKAGSQPAATMWAAMAILSGLIFFALVSLAKADDLPPCSVTYLPVLADEIQGYWPDVPGRSYLAAQIEQETCPSLKSPKCWSPHAELKTDREYGFGLGQVTVTSAFDNFSAARRLSPTLRDWKWGDRYDPRRQMRTLILMDRAGFRAFKAVPDEGERMAMALAAYNGGAGGVQSDRRLCANTPGCDPGKWWGNVELHSLKNKVAAKGYGKSFFEINREYPRKIMIERRPRYDGYFGKA